MTEPLSQPVSRWPKPQWYFYFIVLAIYGADQWTKEIVLDHMVYGQRIEVIPGVLNWILVTNDGIAFGLFQGNNLVLGLVACGILVMGIWLVRSLDWKSLEVNTVGALIVSGAIGNLTDRVRHGHVIDFVDIYLNDWHWPAFNIADSAISLSMCWIILRMIRDGLSDGQAAKSG